MTVHVVGAGLAGLSAALTLADAGRPVAVYESGPQAGGRCRSYWDRELGCRVDNGNHLLLSGNRAAFAFINRVGSRDTMGTPGEPLFPFIDVGTGERWTLRPNAGRLPWWIFSPSRRVPGTTAADYLALVKLRRPSAGAVMSELLPKGELTRRLMEPLAISALNTKPDRALASLMAAVMNETLMQGGASCVPFFPRVGWSESLIDPALNALRARGVPVRLGCRITGLTIESRRITALRTPEGPVELAAGDAAVLAVPAWAAASLLPDVAVPDEFESILNVHFRIDAAAGPAGFVGIVGGAAEWVFVKPGHVSVTISAANRMVDLPAERIAEMVWPDVRAALSLAPAMPPWRVVKEKRATFAATAAQERLRPSARTPMMNLMLAGDWTATGLPATIEGAIRSGRVAAEAILSLAA